jgi:hypothetical protein
MSMGTGYPICLLTHFIQQIDGYALSDSNQRGANSVAAKPQGISHR